MTTKRHRRSIRDFIITFDNVMVMLATVVVIWLAYIIPQNFDFLDPVGQALGDVDLTDMVFSQFRSDQQLSVDTSVVLVNIGYASRDEIADILERVNTYSPAVVGVDVFFKDPKDEFDDSRLAEALRSTKNLVMVSKVGYKVEYDTAVTAQNSSSSGVFDTLITSNPMFMDRATTGFANLVIDQDAAFMTCRATSLLDSCAGRIEPSFALRIAEIVSPKAAEQARARGVELETINFHGNYSSFYNIDVDQALDRSLSLEIVRGKIVLLGFMGAHFGEKSIEDKYFTPMNEHYVGRAFPDMHGVVIHANILGMILNRNYINTMPFWLSIAFGALVLIINVTIFTWVYEQHERWYDMIAVMMQLGQSVSMLFLIVFVFDRFQYKLALTPALFGVFLVGTVHDLYQDSLKKIILGVVDRWKQRHKSASSHT